MPHKATVVLFGGGVSVEVEASNPKGVIEQASFWSSLPQTCPVCGSSLSLDFHEDKYKFYSLLCSGPTRHRSNLGQYKSGDGLFYKGDWEINKRGLGDEDEQPAPAPTPKATPPATQTPAPVARGLVTPNQLEQLRSLIRVAGLANSASKGKSFVLFVLGVRSEVADFGQLEGALVQKTLERLGSFVEGSSGIAYSPDTGKVKKELLRFEKSLELADTSVQSFADLGKA
jgi:hypothetical protein